MNQWLANGSSDFSLVSFLNGDMMARTDIVFTYVGSHAWFPPGLNKDVCHYPAPCLSGSPRYRTCT